jgi:tRNA threonylcarbamoyladenosine biosynthesis protein TsaE
MEAMQTIEIVTNSSEETKKVGHALAATLEKEPLNTKQAFVVALEGDLGSGKTTFIQGLAKGLKVRENVLSPTFVIQKDFSLGLGHYKNFYHIDAYRLKNPEELLELGFEDLISNPENLIVIEWADKVKKILPRNILRIKFENLGKDKRKIIIGL